MADQRHLDVLADRHGMKRLGDLKSAADAPAKPLLRGGEGDGLALEQDDAAIRPELPADHVEDGGFAGAVGADQRDHLAALHGKADLARRDDAAEGFAQPLHRQQAHARSSRHCRIVPTRPRGKTSTMPMIARPRPSRHRDVRGMSWSRRTCSTAEPTSGPAMV